MVKTLYRLRRSRPLCMCVGVCSDVGKVGGGWKTGKDQSRRTASEDARVPSALQPTGPRATQATRSEPRKYYPSPSLYLSVSLSNWVRKLVMLNEMWISQSINGVAWCIQWRRKIYHFGCIIAATKGTRVEMTKKKQTSVVVFLTSPMNTN